MAAATLLSTPPQHKLVKFDLDGHFSYTITCDLRLDLSNPMPYEYHELEAVPLAGKWFCGYTRLGADVQVIISPGPLAIGAFGQQVAYRMDLFWLDSSRIAVGLCAGWADYGPQPQPNPADPTQAYSGWGLSLSPMLLRSAMEASDGKFKIKTHRSYRLTFEIWSLGAEPPTDVADSIAASAIERMPAFDLSPTPHDVRLFFPARNADLWAESGFLSLSSSYFKALLSSDFAETVVVQPQQPDTRPSSLASSISQDRPSSPASKTKRFLLDTGVFVAHNSVSLTRKLCASISRRDKVTLEADGDDSDDETDELYFAEHPPQQRRLDGLQFAYKEIKITKSAFTTYRAVLAYLRTGYIAFAPLTSTMRAKMNPLGPSRSSQITAAVSAAPTYPYPVSPKSAFRLAHLLDLDALQALCLDQLKAQLTIGSAPYELFGHTSVYYEDWRKIVLDFILRNWDGVTASAGWKEIMGRVERNEIEGAAPIIFELMKRREREGGALRGAFRSASRPLLSPLFRS